MGKQKIPPVQPPDSSQFSQLNAEPDPTLQAIRDHLLLVVAWNGLHEQMNLDNIAKKQSDEINQQIKQE